MNPRLVEQEAARRALASAELVCKRRGLTVPGALRQVSGGLLERGAARLQALAVLLEAVALEDVEPGLFAKMAALGYTDLGIIRATAPEDLAVELGEETVARLQDAGLCGPWANEDAEDGTL